ncbi:MAG: DUF4139 domain-containing protein, partial [Spirochaetaceae bacterium]|nr:DUF4139 domain-containing protein [Spirochaetaceae bacterium]
TLITGRIMGVEAPKQAAYTGQENAPEEKLTLFTSQGVRIVSLNEIASIQFTDPQIASDVNRALDLIMTSRESGTRNLTLRLPGAAARDISLGYVIPSPVWKVSYRLDISDGKEGPFIQGWAIVDNDSDTDWKNVQLSLVTGRPVSFIQNLYAPYYLSRPEVPLAIAGIAEANTYDSGYTSALAAEEMYDMEYNLAMSAPAFAPSAARQKQESVSAAGAFGGYGGNTSAQAAGDQFEFTVKEPVTLLRRQSAMIPLVEAAVKAEKTLVFSGSRAANGGIVHPALCAELTNNTGMKLPAGPVTVFDGGSYSGDALLEFFPEGEKRLISYGDDLSVTGSLVSESSREVISVTAAKGVMTITRNVTYTKNYTFRNMSGVSRRLIAEHPVTRGTTLSEPKTFSERTDSLYRFALELPPQRELVFTVKEETPVQERVTLSQLRLDTLLTYVSSGDIPVNMKTALQRAVELKQAADTAAAELSSLETQYSRKVSEQDRIRKNLEAAGNETQQGRDYLNRLVTMDGEIDDISARIEQARTASLNAQDAYSTYLQSISVN